MSKRADLDGRHKREVKIVIKRKDEKDPPERSTAEVEAYQGAETAEIDLGDGRILTITIAE
jgi:hypothetical protein